MRASSAEGMALHKRGLDANRAGDTRGALALFLQAMALMPERVECLLSAANMMLKLGQAAAALELY